MYFHTDCLAKVVFDRTTLAMIIKKALKLRMGKVEHYKDDSDIWSSETQFLYRICPETYAARTKFKPLVRKQSTVYLKLPQLYNLGRMTNSVSKDFGGAMSKAHQDNSNNTTQPKYEFHGSFPLCMA